MAKKQLLIGIVLFGIAILAFAFFGSQGYQVDSGEPAGVLLSAPPGYAIKSAGAIEDDFIPEISRKAIEQLKTDPSENRLAFQYDIDGRKGFFLVNLQDETLGQIVINRFGTAVQKVWQGSPMRRLEHAVQTGSLTPTGYDKPTSRNLYH
ncbi:MAG: hypothetical protein AAFP70_20260 [Calditrichota bacterium]